MNHLAWWGTLTFKFTLTLPAGSVLSYPPVLLSVPLTNLFESCLSPLKIPNPNQPQSNKAHPKALCLDSLLFLPPNGAPGHGYLTSWPFKTLIAVNVCVHHYLLDLLQPNTPSHPIPDPQSSDTGLLLICTFGDRALSVSALWRNWPSKIHIASTLDILKDVSSTDCFPTTFPDFHPWLTVTPLNCQLISELIKLLNCYYYCCCL